MELEELKLISNRATPGPWIFNGCRYVRDKDEEITLFQTCDVSGRDDEEQAHWDAEFIVAARTSIPNIIDELTDLRKWKREFEARAEGAFLTYEMQRKEYYSMKQELADMKLEQITEKSLKEPK